jgi:hypothetical protein
VCKLLNAVSSSAGKEKEYDEGREVRTVMREHMCLDLESLPSRRGLTQCLGYEARSIAALARNNVWMHFVRRVGVHIRNYLNAHSQGTSSTSSTRLLRHQLTLDVCRTPGSEHRSPVQYHAYVEAERLRLGLPDDLFFDSDVGGMRPIAYHLKKSPHLFLPAMDLMSREREQMNQSAFALFPLRRDLTPRHVHFDEKCFRDLLRLPQNPLGTHFAMFCWGVDPRVARARDTAQGWLTGPCRAPNQRVLHKLAKALRDSSRSRLPAGPEASGPGGFHGVAPGDPPTRTV